MKKSVIREMFDGDRSSEFIKMTDAEQKLFETVTDMYDKLLALLNPKQLKLFRKFDDARNDVFAEEVAHFYTEGFKLGLRIGIECME